MPHWLTALWQAVRRLLFPTRCVLCRKPVAGAARAMLCPSCSARLYREYRCTQTLSIPGADAAISPLFYTGTVAEALRRYKFHGGKAYCRWFTAQAAACLTEYLPDWQPDLVTSIPLPVTRWWTRGYNQSADTAELLAAQFHLPYRRTLGKRPLRGKQSRRTAAERQKAAQNSFFALPGSTVAGKRVLLVDDVVTTGSTAADAVRALRQAGAKQVYLLSLTATPPRANRAARR